MVSRYENMVKWLLSGLLLTVPMALVGQQLPVYSQYMMNLFLINPAVAGSEGYTAFNLTARKQWIGIKEAPVTFAASVQTRVLPNSFISRSNKIRLKSTNSSRAGRVGLGGYVFTDRNGLVSRTGMQMTYAYHIDIEKSLLSFGLSGTLWQFRIDKEAARLLDPSDEFFNSMDNGLFIPDANIGVLFSNQRMYAGFSADQLFQSSLKFGGMGFDRYKLYRHFYLMGGYSFELTNDIIMEPSLLFKATHNFNVQMDLTAKAFFYNNYWAGISIRTGTALVLMGGMNVDKFYFGYAIDFPLNSIMRHSYGSHEIIIAVKLGDNARRYKWLHRF